MAEIVQEPPAADPDNVPETLCLGKFNIALSPPLSTITFTHVRPKAIPLVDAGAIEPESVVRARIVTTIDGLVALRDLITRLVENPDGASATAGSKLN